MKTKKVCNERDLRSLLMARAWALIKPDVVILWHEALEAAKRDIEPIREALRKKRACIITEIGEELKIVEPEAETE